MVDFSLLNCVIVTGQDCLCAHLFRFNLVTSPICVLCDTGQDMTAAPLDECSALNDLNCIVKRIWNRFLETGSAGRRPGQGRRRATMPNEDRYLVLTARRHRNMNATLLQQHLRSATGTTVSTQTVRNRLHAVGLYARRPMSCFSVHPDNRRIFIWKDRGSRNNPAFVHESVRFGGAGVLVDEILRPIVVPYAAAIGDDFILMDDNCRPHRANLEEDFLFEEGIVQMEWPACSPGMNPIEHVWDAVGRRVAGRQPSPQTIQELERALLEEWDRIPQLVINSLIDSMPQRIYLCVHSDDSFVAFDTLGIALVNGNSREF
ncbi:transposable element Tcb2 transposase [Trichonephila clavipes]|nr:transposable element Tcb2 transposase [Trichonephila clavipes]